MQRISSELSLPEPTRSRILLEMASDLEALFEHYRARGLPEDEAARRAEEKLLISPEALAHLVAVHTTGYQRWVSRAAGRLRWGFDLLLFAVGVIPMLVISTYVAAAQVQAVGGAVFLWPLLLVAGAIAGIALAKAHQLFVRRERSTVRLNRGVSALVFLGVLGPVIGSLAFFLGVHEVAMLLMRDLSDVTVQLAAVEQVGRAGTLLMLGLLLGFGAALVWFVLVNRIAVIEQAESAALLAVQ